MSLAEVFLRALEPSDIDVLFEIENNSIYWNYADRTEPFSRDLLIKFIKEQDRDIFEVKQKRFVVTNSKKTTLGFVDIFDFEPLHRRAGVGIILKEDYRGRGYGRNAIKLLEKHMKEFFNINCLFANIAIENKQSIQVFEACGYEKIGLKKAWNFYNNRFHDEYLYQKIFNQCTEEK